MKLTKTAKTKIMLIVLLVTVFIAGTLFGICLRAISEGGKSDKRSEREPVGFVFSPGTEKVLELKVGENKKGYITLKGNFEGYRLVSTQSDAVEFYAEKMVGTTRIYYIISARSVGQAILYAETVDGAVKSEEIKVTVISDDTDDAKGEAQSPDQSEKLPADSDKDEDGENDIPDTPDQIPVPPPDTGDTEGSVTPDTPEQAPNENLKIVEFTETVKNGESASVTVSGRPNVEYTIFVHYPSGVSKADGLEAKMSDENGIVIWTWKIGARTAEGEHRIVVSGGGEEIEIYFSTYK